MAVLIIDNYDSFTFNLKHYVEQFDNEVIVVRNDKISLEEVKTYDSIILSPGPGLPQDAGICMDVLKTYSSTKKILGVCLGHQAIGLAFGGKLNNLDEVLHGVARQTILLNHNNPIFDGFPTRFDSGRYHSWVIDNQDFPVELEISAIDNLNKIMAIKHNKYRVFGVQFHPESVLSQFGLKLIENWVKI